MGKTFNHLELAHLLWKEHLRPGMRVVDATAGNGHDTLFLANQVLTPHSGWVYSFDIQEDAILSTKIRLENELPKPVQDRITLSLASHDHFPPELHSIDLFVYNLGYLPGGDKMITTLAETSLASCKDALSRLSPQGMLSVMVYPAHSQGVAESKLLIEYFASLPTTKYLVMHHAPLNRPLSPSLITVRPKPPIVSND
jgi:predicted methyltransferase